MKQYEVKVLHPAVANWLTVNEYVYEHEKQLPTGRIDFVARHSSRSTLFIECKRDCSDVNGIIKGTLKYSPDIEVNAVLVIAVPAATLTTKAVAALKDKGISIIAIDVKPLNAIDLPDTEPIMHGTKYKVDIPLDDNEYAWVKDEAEKEGISRAAFIRRLVKAAYRAARRTPPPAAPKRKRG